MFCFQVKLLDMFTLTSLMILTLGSSAGLRAPGEETLLDADQVEGDQVEVGQLKRGKINFY